MAIMDSFLDNLPKLPNAAETRIWDQAAIKFGIPENMLMENAGRAIYEVATARFGSFTGKRIVLFMGSGGNGGDAACVARHIMDAGGQALVFCEKRLGGEASLWHKARAERDGAKFDFIGSNIKPESLAATLLASGEPPTLIVDGLLGTGFAGQTRADMLARIRLVNAVARIFNMPILAIDIPSGLSAATGKPCPDAIRASITVTLAAAKPGLLLPEAREFTGEIVTAGIGLPKAIEPQCPASWRLVDGYCLKAEAPALVNSHKNSYGHVAVIGGSSGYEGAAHVACASALRGGAGLVTACAPRKSLALIKGGWPEIMTAPVSKNENWPDAAPDNILELVRKCQALVIGPGLGASEQAWSLAAEIISLNDRPCAVIDADALTMLAERPEILARLRADDILTPHPGEASRLLHCQSGEIQASRQEALGKLCQLTKAVVILKGAGTIIGHGEESSENPRLLCPYDIPALAIGGAGDALSGLLGAIMASRRNSSLSPLAKAALGVGAHAMAGLILAESFPHRGALASDIVAALPKTREFVRSRLEKRSVGPGRVLPWPSA